MEFTLPMLGALITLLVFVFGVVKHFAPNKSWEKPLVDFKESTNEELDEINKEVDQRLSTMSNRIQTVEKEMALSLVQQAAQSKRTEEILTEIRMHQKEFQVEIKSKIDNLGTRIDRRNENAEDLHSLLMRLVIDKKGTHLRSDPDA